MHLADFGAEVLRSERQAVLMAPKLALEAAPKRSRRGGGGSRRSEPSIELSPDDQALFESLRTLRRELAQELGVPPYVVFSDVTLEGLAHHRPTNEQAMLGIKGIGQKKLDSFGDRFLRAIADHGASAAGS